MQLFVVRICAATTSQLLPPATTTSHLHELHFQAGANILHPRGNDPCGPCGVADALWLASADGGSGGGPLAGTCHVALGARVTKVREFMLFS